MLALLDTVASFFETNRLDSICSRLCFAINHPNKSKLRYTSKNLVKRNTALSLIVEGWCVHL